MTIAHFDILDPAFKSLVDVNADVEKLFTGCRWAEGPAYFPAGRYLVWSDIPNDRLLQFSEADNRVSVLRQPSNYANGNTVDRQGRLVTCEHGGRRVTRTEHDGAISVLADRYQDARLNSPNDVVVKSDGTIWFTDPTYGIESDYQGRKAPGEIGGSFVYRIPAGGGAAVAMITEMSQPNGLAFSLDETKLYVVDSGRTHGDRYPAHIKIFDVGVDNSLSAGRVFVECPNGLFDGFRLDEQGRLWVSTFEGINCYLPDGRLIGRIRVPEVVSNCVFGGIMRNRLFITGTTSLYSVYLSVNGIKTF